MLIAQSDMGYDKPKLSVPDSGVVFDKKLRRILSGRGTSSPIKGDKPNDGTGKINKCDSCMKLKIGCQNVGHNRAADPLRSSLRAKE